MLLVAINVDPRVKGRAIAGVEREHSYKVFEETYDLFVASKTIQQAAANTADTAAPIAIVLGKRPASAMAAAMASDDFDCPIQYDVAPTSPPDEIDEFAKQPTIPFGDCALPWWKHNASRFPKLAAIARAYLPIPASSAASECVFPAAALVVSHMRRGLDPDRVSRLTWMKKNMFLYEVLKASNRE